MSGTHGVDKAPFCARAVTILGTSSRAEFGVKSENYRKIVPILGGPQDWSPF